jgi:DNA primase
LGKEKHFCQRPKSLVGQLVSETILTFRRHLVDQKIQNLVTVAQKKELPDGETELLEEVMQYQNLKKLLSKKLNRVL